ALTRDEKKYLDIFKNWNLDNEAQQQGATVFKVWWDSLMTTTYGDEYRQTNLPLPWPDDPVLLSGLAKDSAYSFADDINTPQKEMDKDVIQTSFKKAAEQLLQLDNEGLLQWSDYKQSAVMHLLKIPAFSRESLLSNGGDGIINAFTKTHGPSWKMVVEMTDGINAYGIYPGGQAGNPGSKYYDNFINDYLAGKYYKLLFVSQDVIQKTNNLKGKITFSKLISK
ncbi:MAG TPA: penicillin acylase family protein, partial [Chitinophagaceae bacterium]|nr:penicillin acylase family protein [Chitinophagaceae bacterium]